MFCHRQSSQHTNKLSDNDVDDHKKPHNNYITLQHTVGLEREDLGLRLAVAATILDAPSFFGLAAAGVAFEALFAAALLLLPFWRLRKRTKKAIPTAARPAATTPTRIPVDDDAEVARLVAICEFCRLFRPDDDVDVMDLDDLLRG